MVYRKKTRKRTGKRRGYKKKFHKRAPRRIQNNFHYFKQHAELGNLEVVAGTPKFFANSFQLSQLVNVTSFDTLYDHYRINAVKVTYYPPYSVYNATSVAGTNVANVPELYLVTDTDSSVPVDTIGQLDSYTHCKRRFFTKPVSIFLRPKVTMPVYNAGGNAFCNPIKNPWIDMVNKDVIYYGVLGAITCSQQANLPAMLIRVTADFYVSMKNVR